MSSLAGIMTAVSDAVRLQASLALYGNGAGVKNNRVGRRLRQAAERTDVGPCNNATATMLLEKGFAPVDLAYDPALLEQMQDTVDAALDDPRHSVNAQAAVVPGVKDPARRLTSALDSGPILRQLINARVRDIVTAYYRGHFRIVEATAWRNVHIPNAHIDAYSNLWHFDRLNIAHLKLFVNLGGIVDRTTGAFRVQSIARTREIGRSGFLHRAAVVGRAHRLIEDPADMLCLEGGLGAACFANTALCLHRAGIPAPDAPRLMASFTFLPARSALPAEWTLDRPSQRNTL